MVFFMATFCIHTGDHTALKIQKDDTDPGSTILVKKYLWKWPKNDPLLTTVCESEGIPFCGISDSVFEKRMNTLLV